jgi:hemolysin D
MEKMSHSVSMALPPIAESDSNTVIRVVMVDDQPFVLKMLQFFLDNAKDIEVVGTAGNGEAALDLIAEVQPDIALVDIEMPGMDGLALTQAINAQFPQLRVLMLSSHQGEQYIHQALMAGARGYLVKGTVAEDIIHSIRYVQEGYIQLGSGLYEKLEKATLGNGAEEPEEPSLTQVIAPEACVIEQSLSEQIEADRREWDWSPDLGEPLNPLPRLWTKGLRYFIVTVSVIALPWSFWARVNETEVVRGRINPSGTVQRIKAPADGIVSAVRVQEGQLVQRGQILVEVGTDELRADLRQIQAELKGQISQLNQLEQFKNQVMSGLERQDQQNQAQMAAADLVPARKVIEVEWESRRLRNQAERAVRQAQQRLAAEKASYQRAQQQQQNNQPLAAFPLDGHDEGKRTFSQPGESVLLKNQGQWQKLEGQITQMKTEVKQSESQAKRINLEIRKRTVRSPITGTIFELPIKKDKAFVQTGQLVAQIAPQNAPMIVRAQIPSANSGFLLVGQPVKLKFDAYPYQDYGTNSGRVRWIAPNSRLMTVGNAQTEVFDLEVTMDRPYLQAASKQILLTPGQSVSAEVIVRQRRIIDFLLDPFRKLQEDGLKLWKVSYTFRG